MGRYYGTQQFDGKFGFGIQSSYDPVEVFGMDDETSDDEDENEASFYLESTDDDLKRIKHIIDEQYDFLEIPEDKRIYIIKTQEQVWELFQQFEDQLYRPYVKGKDQGIPYWSAKYSEGVLERKPGVQLAKCRIDLGTKIYTELKQNGYCSMWAEL